MYDLKKERRDYCILDVKSLLMVFKSFQQNMIRTSGIDPITTTFTTASIALKIFRTNHLGNYQIGITPVKGYGVQRKQSHIGNAYLDWLSKTREIIREYK